MKQVAECNQARIRARVHAQTLIAALAVGVLPAAVQADVVYSGVVNLVVPATYEGLYLNVESGISSSVAAEVPGYDINPWGTSTEEVALFAPFGTKYMRNPFIGTLLWRTKVPLWTSISELSSFYYGGSSAVLGTLVGQWSASNSGLYGFQFEGADGLPHFGWVRMLIGANATDRVIKDYAYETTPMRAVPAGYIGGALPQYNPCAITNPVATLGDHNFPINSTGAPTISIDAGCGGTLHHANSFKFVVPDSGLYRIHTCESGVDTRLAVLGGCAFNSNLLSCSDDSCGSGSNIQIDLSEGQVVYITVGGATPKVSIPNPVRIGIAQLDPPACVNATEVLLGANAFDMAGSTLTQSVVVEASSIATTIYKSRILTFTPLTTSAYTISTCGSQNDTVLAIGETCPPGGSPFVAIAMNDDGCACSTGCGAELWSSSLTSTSTGAPLTQSLEAGKTYFILLGGYEEWTPATSGSLVVARPPAPCDADLTGDGVVDGSDLAALLNEWGNAAGDVNGDGTTDGGDISVVLLAWGSCA